MTHSYLVVVLASLVAACSDDPPRRPHRESPPPAPDRIATPAECRAAARGGLGSPGGTGLGAAANAELRAAREQVIVRCCTEDRWPASAAHCYAEADGLREIGRCWLPPEPSRHLTAELQDVMHGKLGIPR